MSGGKIAHIFNETRKLSTGLLAVPNRHLVVFIRRIPRHTPQNSDSILAYGFLTVVNPFSKYVAGGVCISSDPPLTHGSDKSNGLLPAVSPELHDPIFPPACPTIDSTDVPPAFGMLHENW